MYSAGTESLIKQAREIQDEELQKFYVRVSKMLSSKEHCSETIDSLQRLKLIVSATKYARLLPAEVQNKLQTLLRSPGCPEQLRLLCSAVLSESLPPSVRSLSAGLTQDCRSLGSVAAIVLAQAGNKDELLPLCQHLLKCLESRQPEGQICKHTLPILSKIISFFPEILSEDQINLVNRKLVDWLRYASVHQGASLSSGGFFTGPRSRQPGPMTEVDGVVVGDFFTVLCVGQSYTEDQWMNMYAFSMLRKWLLTYDSEGTCNTESDDRSEVDSSVMSMVSATSSSSRLLPPKERLREKSFEYCQRLIEQSDRKAIKRTDTELQKVCLIEAVAVMDIICKEDSSYVYRAFPCLKALYGRLSGDLAFARALMPIAQFYLNHSEMAAVDSEAVFRHLLSRFPSEMFNEPLLAFEFVQFCRLNMAVLQERVPLYRQSFPNIFKFLAWNSPALIADYMELLPSLMCRETAVEILHTLLDLPCLAATLDLQQKSATFQAADRVLWDNGTKLANCLEAFRQPSCRGLFLYILRPEAEKQSTLPHSIVTSCGSNCVFCVYVYNTYTVIKFFFNVLENNIDGKTSIFNDITVKLCFYYRVFSAHIRTLCKLHPSLLIDQSRELLDFAGSVSNISSKKELYTSVVWMIGEYLSVSYDKRCTVELITSFFESLEAVLLEITQVRQSTKPPNYHPRVLTVLMTTLSKLASRSQDLIPRLSLSLSKMRTFAQSAPVASCYSEEDIEEIITRASELVNLLKLPNVAQFVLAPSPHGDNPRWHKDTNTSLPHSMRAVSGLLHKNSSFLPG
uniref:AP-5 complex subunit zeta-1 n=1 Tax=Denticeps clupeoides TaxID=299321 RepID=A0AAY4BUM4_9TELE